MYDMEGKVALVTGGAGGIGTAISAMFLKQGASVAITEVTEELADAGVRRHETDRIKGYVGSAKEVVEKVLADFGRVDILVCNAGITRDQLAVGMPEEDWDAVIDVNLKGAFQMVQALYRTFMKQRSGRIITISSVVGLTGQAGQTNYAASKGGLISMTRSLAKELGSRNVTANTVAPGFIATKMTKVLGEEAEQMAAKATPLRRVGTPEDVAGVVSFFASEAASYVTGQVIAVDGGMAIGGGW
jgi:3-oxoacyl-[acyl-carrier protein] reductase